MRIWDPETGKVINTLQGHRDFVRSLCISEQWICSGSYDQTIKLWDRETGKLILDLQKGHDSWIFDVQFERTKIVSCCQEGRVCIWDFGNRGLPTQFIA